MLVNFKSKINTYQNSDVSIDVNGSPKPLACQKIVSDSGVDAFLSHRLQSNPQRKWKDSSTLMIFRT